MSVTTKKTYMAILINLKRDFSEQMQVETDKYIRRLIENGVEYIPWEIMIEALSKIGLRFDLSRVDYSYNTLNEQHHYDAFIGLMDDYKMSPYNVASRWYNENLSGDFQSEKGRNLYNLRQNYFTTRTYKGILYPVFF